MLGLLAALTLRNPDGGEAAVEAGCVDATLQVPEMLLPSTTEALESCSMPHIAQSPQCLTVPHACRCQAGNAIGAGLLCALMPH